MHITSEMADLGSALRALREAQGLRQDELATAAGVSTRTVHAIEAGKPTARIDGIMRLANALGHRLALQAAGPRRSSASPQLPIVADVPQAPETSPWAGLEPIHRDGDLS